MNILKYNKIALLVFFLLGLFSTSFNQVQAKKKEVPNIVIKGSVVNEFGEPVQGAVVTAKSVMGSVTSDKQGKFSLEIPVTEAYVTVHYVGYRSARMNPEKESKVTLVPDAHQLNKREPSLLLAENTKLEQTGAVGMVSGDLLRKTPSMGLAAALAGKVAGLAAVQSSSVLGWDGADLKIRGLNSLNGNNVMILLDGVPMPCLDLKTLNLETIESVTVLKDASALVAYGYESANGAILITTKRGQTHGLKVDVTTDFSLQQAMTTPKIMNSWEYASLRRQAQLNDKSQPTFTQEQVDAYARNDGNVLYPNNNWYNMFIRDIAPMQRYNLSLTGGDPRVQYYVNAGYMHQESLVNAQKNDLFDPSSYLNRLNVLANLDVNIFKNLKMFVRQNLTIDCLNSNPYGDGDIFASVMNTPSTMIGPLTDDGSVVASTQIQDPLYGKLNKKGYNYTTNTSMNVSLGFDLKMDFITKGLSLKGIAAAEGYFNNTMSGRTDYVRMIRDESIQDKLVFIPYGSWKNEPLSLSKGSSLYYSMNFQTSLNYNRLFGGVHQVTANVGYYNQQLFRNTFSNLETLPYNRIVLSGHLKYGYDSRYYLEATGGYGGSDQFLPEERFGFFPSVAAAWVVSNEHFMSEALNESLSLLKFRASYSAAGNDQTNIPRMAYNSYITVGGGFIGSLAGGSAIYEGLRGNPYLRWEDSYQQNYGVDLGLFNAVTLSVDYFRNYTQGIVQKNNFRLDVLGVSSGNLPYENLGEVFNHGFEIDVKYNKTFSKDYSMILGGYVAFAENEIREAGEIDKSSNNYAFPYRNKGYSIGQNFGYLIDYSNGNGYFNSQEEILQSKLQYVGLQPRVGDFIYQDLNGDKMIDEKDQAPIGYNSRPKINYALSAQAKLKDFDIYLQFQGAALSSSYVSGYGAMESHAQGVYTELHKEAWTSERYANGETIAYPALTAKESSSHRANDFFIINTDFLRLKNVEVGYTLPSKLTRKILIDRVRVYFSGSNLLTFDSMKFKSLDPESPNLASYPLHKAYNVGLSVSF